MMLSTSEGSTFAGGLEELGIKKMMSNLPELMKPLFVYMGAIKPKDVILKPIPRMNKDQQRVWGYLLAYINEASKEGIAFITLMRYHCIM